MTPVGFGTRSALSTGFAVMMVGLIAVIGSMTAVFGAARGTSFAPCLTDFHGASVEVATGFSPQAGPAIATITIGNLSSAGCDGSPVTATLKGNKAGNPNAAADETLSVLNSKLEPCTQAPLAKPPTVSDGTISLATCPSGGHARPPSIHDLTRVIIRVRGRLVKTGTTVLGEHQTRHAPSSQASTIGELPFTGSWAALTFWAGIVAIALGIALLVGSRRRRWSLADLDEPPVA